MDKHRLMVMRHAKSDRSDPSQQDFDRPLNARGRKTAPRMGKWLKKNKLVPATLISSHARRARETALLVAGKLRFPEARIIWDERVYNGTVDGLLEVIRSHRGDLSALLVGHNPGLDDLLAYLCAGPLPLDEEGKLLTTGAIAVVALDPDMLLGRGGAKLEKLIRPGELEYTD